MTRRGRKNFEATESERRNVELYAAAGISHEQIAMLITRDGKPISVDTLTRHFPLELSTGNSKATAVVAGKLYQKALAGDVTSMIFWLKTRAGWRETNRQEHVPIDPEAEERTELDDAARMASLVEAAKRRKTKSGG